MERGMIIETKFYGIDNTYNLTNIEKIELKLVPENDNEYDDILNFISYLYRRLPEKSKLKNYLQSILNKSKRYSFLYFIFVFNNRLELQIFMDAVYLFAQTDKFFLDLYNILINKFKYNELIFKHENKNTFSTWIDEIEKWMNNIAT